MKGDFHVRFCERLRLKCLCLLDRIKPSFGTNYLTLSKSQAAVPGGRNAISTPAQSPARYAQFEFTDAKRIISRY